MELLRQGALASLLFIGFFSCTCAQDAQRGATNARAEAQRPVLTGKERLGPKWTDEQRIDNCKVPIDKRGTKPRPSTCPNGPSS
jgi:hypothetical protein